MMQTVAIFVGAYRELSARKIFWLALAISLLVVGLFASSSPVAASAGARLERLASSAVASSEPKCGHHVGSIEELRVAHDDARLVARYRRRKSGIVERTRAELLLAFACDRHGDAAHLAPQHERRALHAESPLFETAASRLELILEALRRALLERRGERRASPDVRSRLGPPQRQQFR